MIRRASLLVAVGLFAILGFAANPAGAGGPAPTLKVAKHAGGPYSSSIGEVNLPAGTTKSFYFKVKNGNPTTVDAALSGTGNETLYRVRWFRGDKDITDKIVLPEAVDVSLDPGDVKKYRARVRHKPTMPMAVYCLYLVAGGPFTTQFSSVGINGLCP